LTTMGKTYAEELKFVQAKKRVPLDGAFKK
jgi:hypothetical protein